LPRRFKPKFFDPEISSGIPILTTEGRKMIEEELKEPAPYTLEEAPTATSTTTAAAATTATTA
jgi:hypothetical protein